MNEREIHDYYRWWFPMNGLTLLVCHTCRAVVPRFGAKDHYEWHKDREE